MEQQDRPLRSEKAEQKRSARIEARKAQRKEDRIRKRANETEAGKD